MWICRARMPKRRVKAELVGPVLQASELGRAVLEAIQQLNPSARVLDRGAYYRVNAESPCVLTRAAVERITGQGFALPGDLEQVMPSFQGFLALDADRVEWRAGRA
jgi:MmoB/DmpM family